MVAGTVKYRALNPGRANITKQLTASSNFDSWTTRSLSFNGTAIDEVVADLETYFDRTIVLNNTSSTPCLFTGTFKEPTYESITEVLAFTFDLNQTKDGTTEVWTIESCE